MSFLQKLSLSVIFLSNLSSPHIQQASIQIIVNQVLVEYPEQITFLLQASSTKEIESVELIFGTDAITCGENITRAIPEDYEATDDVDVEWKFLLRRSGTLPPGTEIWWYWQLVDSDGTITDTPKQAIRFIDEIFQWQLHSSGSLDIYWYFGSESFIRELSQAGETALEYLYQATGVEIEERVGVYIYEDSDALQSATLFSPDWGGGLAFSDHRTVLAGIPPNSISWGKEVVAHELTHVLIGVYTFSCVDTMPIWLNEGLAMFMEKSVGVGHDSEKERLSSAIEGNSLLSVKEISYIFSDDPDLARQSYAQSLSLVEFLIESYGQEKMLMLLDKFKQGLSQDRALKEVYGYNQDSLNIAWREWVGAPPLEGTPVPESTPTWTPYPTIAPYTGPVIFDTETPVLIEAIPQKSETNTPVPELQPSTDGLIGFSTYLVVGGGVVLFFIILFFVFTRFKKPDP